MRDFLKKCGHQPAKCGPRPAKCGPLRMIFLKMTSSTQKY